MIRSILFLLTCTLIVGCSDQQAASTSEPEQQNEPKRQLPEEMTPSVILSVSQLDSFVETLVSDMAKVAYFREIIQEDQRVRTEESAVVQRYGYDSDQHKLALDACMAVDQQNMEKLDKYYEKYGGPANNSVGLMQSEATWYVVHHSSGVSARNRYFESLKFAYENELISGGQYTLFLNRWNEQENGERLVMEGSYTEDEEIAKLYELLGVD